MQAQHRNDDLVRLYIAARNTNCDTAKTIQREYWTAPGSRLTIVNGGAGAYGYVLLKRYPGWRCTSGAGAGRCRKGNAFAGYSYQEGNVPGEKRFVQVSFPPFGFLHTRSTLAVHIRAADGSAINDPSLRIGVQLKRYGRVYVNIGSVPANGRTRVLVPVEFPSDVRPPQPVRLKAYVKGPNYLTTWTKSFVVDLR